MAGTSKRVCSVPFRESASTSSTREPLLAIVMDKLAAVSDLPSFGTELVTMRDLARSPPCAIYSREERRFR